MITLYATLWFIVIVLVLRTIFICIVFVQVLVLDVLNLKLVNYGMSYLLMLEIYSLLIVSNLNFESSFLACVDLIGVAGIMCYTVL